MKNKYVIKMMVRFLFMKWHILTTEKFELSLEHEYLCILSWQPCNPCTLHFYYYPIFKNFTLQLFLKHTNISFHVKSIQNICNSFVSMAINSIMTLWYESFKFLLNPIYDLPVSKGKSWTVIYSIANNLCKI